MKIMNFLLVSLLIMSWAKDSHAEKNQLYRYVDPNGLVVIRNTLPADRAGMGYDVLDSQGRLVETIPPQEKNLSEKILAEQEKKKREEYDISLIRRYSFVEDIESERKRKVSELSVRVSILKGNLTGIRSELEAAYAEAAGSERKGEELPQPLKKRITQLEEKIKTTEDVLKNREEEITLLDQQYVRAIERFKEIQALKNRALQPVE